MWPWQRLALRAYPPLARSTAEGESVNKEDIQRFRAIQARLKGAMKDMAACRNLLREIESEAEDLLAEVEEGQSAMSEAIEAISRLV